MAWPPRNERPPCALHAFRFVLEADDLHSPSIPNYLFFIIRYILCFLKSQMGQNSIGEQMCLSFQRFEWSVRNSDYPRLYVRGHRCARCSRLSGFLGRAAQGDHGSRLERSQGSWIQSDRLLICPGCTCLQFAASRSIEQAQTSNYS